MISAEDRWRLILGSEQERLSAGAGLRAGAALEELYGAQVKEQVLGRAVERGRTDALLELSPERVTPSVELLRQLLSLKGGLPEERLQRLRRLVSHIVE